MRVGDRKFRICVVLSLSFALFSALRWEGKAAAQAGPSTDQQFQPLIHSLDGQDLFRAYCASCHGSDAKGHGPAASALRATVPDLTALAKNNGGRFPSSHVRSTITGEEAFSSHGSREMPIWGPVFHQIEADVDEGNVRVENLVKYLESIQSLQSSEQERAKNISTESIDSGAQLYKKYCAACHGNDLKGNGPAPYPFKDMPPDLTTLAKRHDGKFPDEYFSAVMRNGVLIPAHGPPEMPTWGTDFRAMDRLDEAQVAARIANLRNYIKSLQAK